MPMPRLCGGMLLIGLPPSSISPCVAVSKPASIIRQSSCPNRRSEHGDELAGLDIEIQIFDDERLAIVTLLHVAKTYKWVGTVKHSLYFQTVSPNIRSG